MIDFGASSKLTNWKVFHKIVFHKKYVFFFLILSTEKTPVCLYAVIWYNFHHSMIQLLPQITQFRIVVILLNRWTFAVYFYFICLVLSYWLTSSAFMLYVFIQAAFLCLHLELASWADGCMKARSWALSINFFKGFSSNLNYILILQHKSMKFLFK